jgi:hypothetical protein
VSRAPVVALFVSALLASACQTPVVAPRPLPDLDSRPTQFLEAIEVAAKSRSGLRAAAKLSLEAPDLKLRRPQRLAVERPAKLRIEILGLFNQVAAVLVTDGSHYQFLDVSQTQMQQGTMTPALLWQYARVDLQPERAVDLLLGAPRPIEGLTPHAVEALAEQGVAVVLRGNPAAAWQRYEFDAVGRLGRVVTFDPVGDIVWEARYEDYRELEGVAFPFGVLLSFPRLRAETRVTYKNVQLNPDLPEGTFVLNVPGRVPGPKH